MEKRNKRLNLLVMMGDGIGPEIITATMEVLQAVDRRFGIGLSFETAETGLKAHQATGTTFPHQLLERARAADGIVLGPVSHNAYPPLQDGGLNPSGELRKHLDLYAFVMSPKATRKSPMRSDWSIRWPRSWSGMPVASMLS